MNFEIVELDDLTGSEATIYSIIPEGETETLFEKFVSEYLQFYQTEIMDMITRIKQMGQTTGARHSFFKHDEGKPGDGVCALFDLPEKGLRLYCIRYGTVAFILGGGGPKPKSITAWQDDPKLTLEAEKMIAYADNINNRIKSKDLYWSKYSTLEGNLKNYDNDEDN